MTLTAEITNTIPIDQLPNEILSEIFLDAVPDLIVIGNNIATPSDTLDPFCISGVCKRWKDTVESTSAIWSRVALDLDNVPEDSSMMDRILEDVKRCIKSTKNSETRRFSFSAQGTSSNDAKVITKALVHVLTSMSSRLVSLKLNCFRMDVFDLEYNKWLIANNKNPKCIQPLDHESVTFPLLEELQLLWGCNNPLTHILFDFEMTWLNSPFTQLFQDVPHLRSLTLDSLRPLNDFNWSNITHLKIVNIYSSCAFLHYVDIFPEMRNLETLGLSFIQRSPEYYTNIDTDDETVQRPVLEHLKRIMITSFLNEKLEEGCQYARVYEIDLNHILKHIPLAMDLEWVYARTYFIESEGVDYNQRIVEEPIDDYILQSGCVGQFHKKMQVSRCVEMGRKLFEGVFTKMVYGAQ